MEFISLVSYLDSHIVHDV